MPTIDIPGFGNVSASIAVLRHPGQSRTCHEQQAGLNVGNDWTTDIAFVQLDGGFYPKGDACDFSISSLDNQPTGFLLELKGRDMEHAIEQLGRSLAHLAADGISVVYRLAAVVSSGARKIPSGTWQKRQKTFLAQNRVRLGRFPNHSSISFGKAIGV